MTVVLPLALSAAGAVPTAGQRVFGRVIEERSERGVGLARIRLIAADSSVSAATTADSAGFFVLDSASPGSQVLRVDALGYASRSDSVTIAAGEVINVVVRLAPEGMRLAPLEVRARGGLERGRFGFERRSALGRGVFLTADSIAARDPRVATDALRGVPGVININDNVFSMTGGKCLVIYVDHRLSPVQVGRRPSPRQVMAGSLAGSDALNLITDVGRIRGIEVYRDLAEVPRELRTAMRMEDLAPVNRPLFEACGLAWVWTDIGW
jgi:hypothetical protein